MVVSQVRVLSWRSRQMTSVMTLPGARGVQPAELMMSTNGICLPQACTSNIYL